MNKNLRGGINHFQGDKTRVASLHLGKATITRSDTAPICWRSPLPRSPIMVWLILPEIVPRTVNISSYADLFMATYKNVVANMKSYDVRCSTGQFIV